MSKIVSSAKVAEKFNHFTDVHFETSICVNIDSSEMCVYILGRKFRINRCICIAVNENGEVISLNLDNLIIAAKPKYSNDFVGYISFGEECVKISTKSPYNYNHAFVFAFVCENVALSVILTKPVAKNASLSGMFVDIGMKGNNSNNYNKVMEDISAISSLLNSTALRNVKSDGEFAGFFEHLSTLPCKSMGETALTERKEDYDDV